MEEFSQLGGNPCGGFASTSKATEATAATTAAVVNATPSSSSIYWKKHCSPDPHLRSKPAEASSSRCPFGRREGQAQATTQIDPAAPRDHVHALKARIVSHPHYSSLISTFMDCQKVGAPPEVAARLSATACELEEGQRAAISCSDMPVPDPELDQFMEAYYHMLLKYREELARPLQEAMEFFQRSVLQLNSLSPTNGSLRLLSSADEKYRGVCSSDQEVQLEGSSSAEKEPLEIDAGAYQDRELKQQLLKRYSGHLSSLRQELSKKKKKEKLPREARQQLLSWWELHCRWPYPSETQKVALAESTGLDLKQISNWFINQRKRHWKPSEDMQFVVMNPYRHHPQNAGAFYMDGHFVGDGLYHGLGGP